MKKKFLAAVMGAAMVMNISPVITFAESVADSGAVSAAEEAAGVADGSSDAVVEITEPETKEVEPAEMERAEAGAAEAETVETEAVQAEMTEQLSVADMSAGQFTDHTQEAASAAEITDQTSLEAAIAQGGTIDLTGKTITLERPLTVSNSVTITGGTLVGTASAGYSNLVTLTGDSATLDGVTIITAAENKSALHAYKTVLEAKNLTIDHTNAAGGAPVIINGGSAVFTGNVSLKLGVNSWYGINVDNATADFSGASIAKIDTPVATQSVVCAENGGSVPGRVANTTEVVTADGQTAYVQDEDLPGFLKAKKEKDVVSVTLLHDVELSEPLYLEEQMTVNGQGFYFNGTAAIGRDNVVTVMAGESDAVSLNDLGIRTDAANKSALHIYKSRAALRDITLDNTNTAGGAGMIVNGGTADVSGSLNILLGENSWGGINVDGINGESNVNFAEGSAVAVKDESGKEFDAIYIENDDVNRVEISGAENAGLVQDENGNYVVKETVTEPEPAPEPAPEPEVSEENTPAEDSGADNSQNKEGKEEATKNPKTGDSSALLLALSALAGSGAAGTLVIRKRKEM